MSLLGRPLCRGAPIGSTGTPPAARPRGTRSWPRTSPSCSASSRFPGARRRPRQRWSPGPVDHSRDRSRSDRRIGSTAAAQGPVSNRHADDSIPSSVTGDAGRIDRSSREVTSRLNASLCACDHQLGNGYRSQLLWCRRADARKETPSSRERERQRTCAHSVQIQLSRACRSEIATSHLPASDSLGFNAGFLLISEIGSVRISRTSKEL